MRNRPPSGPHFWLTEKQVCRIFDFVRGVGADEPDASTFHPEVRTWIEDHITSIHVHAVEDWDERGRYPTTWDFQMIFQSESEMVLFKLRWHSVWTGQAD